MDRNEPSEKIRFLPEVGLAFPRAFPTHNSKWECRNASKILFVPNILQIVLFMPKYNSRRSQNKFPAHKNTSIQVHGTNWQHMIISMVNEDAFANIKFEIAQNVAARKFWMQKVEAQHLTRSKLVNKNKYDISLSFCGCEVSISWQIKSGSIGDNAIGTPKNKCPPLINQLGTKQLGGSEQLMGPQDDHSTQAPSTSSTTIPAWLQASLVKPPLPFLGVWPCDRFESKPPSRRTHNYDDPIDSATRISSRKRGRSPPSNSPSPNLAATKVFESAAAEASFTCDMCFQSFNNSWRLRDHIRTHENDKPYHCRWTGCHKAFTLAANLKTHTRTHTGERPFICSFEGCSKAFTTSGNLKGHERIHTGEKPFKCDFPKCGKAFSESGSLTKHRRTHTGEKPYTCVDCRRSFAQVGHLTRHVSCHRSGGLVGSSGSESEESV
jgi:hypothetical protein